MSRYLGARTEAERGVVLDDHSGVAAAWDALVGRYGYELAARAWGAACNAVEVDAEVYG